MSFKQMFGKALETANKNHDVLSKVRNALIVYLALIALFRAVLWIGSRYAEGESYAAFTLYSSFILIAVGGLGVAAYSYIGIRNIVQPKSPLEEERKKLIEEQRRMDQIRKKLKKQEKQIKGIYESGASAKKTDGIITRLFSKSPDREALLAEKRKLREQRLAFEEEKKAIQKLKGEIEENMKKEKEEVTRKEVKRQDMKIKGISRMPGAKHQRMEMFRKAAMQLQKEKGYFTVSGMMEAMVQSFPSEVDEDRKGFLKEIEEWVAEDPYTPLLRTENGVRIYRMITKK